jgi:hypothetical protein
MEPVQLHSWAVVARHLSVEESQQVNSYFVGFDLGMVT